MAIFFSDDSPAGKLNDVVTPEEMAEMYFESVQKNTPLHDIKLDGMATEQELREDFSGFYEGYSKSSSDQVPGFEEAFLAVSAAYSSCGPKRQ